MVCVDTSVWIAHFRRGKAVSEHLKMLARRDEVLLPTPARYEFLAGIPAKQFAEIRDYFQAFQLLVPNRNTWEKIDDWANVSATKGQRFGLGDMLIAALAAEHGVPIWSLDHDFERMESLGFCRVYRPGRTAAS